MTKRGTFAALRSRRFWWAGIAALLSAQGCATRAQVKQAPAEAGVASTYLSSFERVRKAAAEILTESGFGAEEVEALGGGRWRIIASQGLTTGTFGRIVRITVEERITDCAVRVLVQSKLDTADARAADAAIANDLQRKLSERLKPAREN